MLTLVTPPTVEPVSVQECKDWLRVDHSADDALILALATAARHYCEDRQNRAYCSQTWKASLDAYPAAFSLWRSPVVSVTSVQYVDTDGATQTLSSSEYTLDALSEPGRVVPAYNASWPSIRAVPNAVTLTFVCGYGAAADVPEIFKSAIKMYVADAYENRESIVVGPSVNRSPITVDMMLQPDRLMVVS